MNGSVLVQLYLLSQMRASTLVAEAVARLGMTQEDLKAARGAGWKMGLGRLVHPMDLYRRLLGEPLSEVHSQGGDPFRRLIHHYRLPTWPQFNLSVLGNAAGTTSGLCFSAPEGLQGSEIHSGGQLAGWSLVESQLAQVVSAATVVDEWYPMADYECSLPGAEPGAHSKWYLRFDFGLLQSAEAVE
jgi:hypothetical protein